MTAAPTYATWQLVLLAIGGLSLFAFLVLVLAAAWLGRYCEDLLGDDVRGTPDEVLAIQARERLVDAAHAWAPTPGEPVTTVSRATFASALSEPRSASLLAEFESMLRAMPPVALHFVMRRVTWERIKTDPATTVVQERSPFGGLHGVAVRFDNSMPANVVRVEMSDGSVETVDLTTGAVIRIPAGEPVTRRTGAA